MDKELKRKIAVITNEAFTKYGDYEKAVEAITFIIDEIEKLEE